MHNDITDIDGFNQDTRNFLEIKCSGMTFEDLRNAIEEIEVRNILKSKMPKFNTQLYAFVYDKLIDFPSFPFTHSHVTGKIIGYVHDFCNWQVRENKTEISVFAHNLFRFDAFFFFKGFQAMTWGTKDINIGNSNLTHISFANINGGEVKLTDTLKYYQKSLPQLASTLSEKENKSVKKITRSVFKTARLLFRNIEVFRSKTKRETLRHYCRQKRYYSLRKNNRSK